MNRPTVLRNSAESKIVIGIALKIFYNANDWIDNATFLDKLDYEYDAIGKTRESRSGGQAIAKYKPAVYYGLLDTHENGSHRINDYGRRYYEAYTKEDNDGMVDCLISSIETHEFGRNNPAVPESKSRIEPPKVFLVSCLLLNNILSKTEYAYILESLSEDKDYQKILVDVSLSRLKGSDLVISNYAKNNYCDDKGLKFLSDAGFFDEGRGTKSIKQQYVIKYSEVLSSLAIVTSENITHPHTTNTIHTTFDVMSSSNSKIITAIHTKPFLILGGFSGTGKSLKVKELAYLTCPKVLQEEKTPGNYALISVKPNWHDSTELLGYESTIANKYMVTDFMRFVVKAMQHPETPFFCCMDEMNLAPVEEYFAEYLSVLESRKKVQDKNGAWHIVSEPLVSADVFKKSYDNNAQYSIFEDLGLIKVGRTISQNEAKSVGQSAETTSEAFEREDIVDMLKHDGLCIPENLVIIGTVNMDDTTNSFSRKVIDRAMIFETDIEIFDKDKYFNAADTLQYGNMDGSAFICDEVRADQAIKNGYELSEDERQTIIDYINDLNKAMAGTSFQVSYRVLNETILYYRSMRLLNGDKASLEQVKNDILMMKVLPRIEGDSAAKKALVGLRAMIEKQDIPSEWINLKYDIDAEEIKTKPDTPWKESILKIAYMLHLLNTGDGFTRFWK